MDERQRDRPAPIRLHVIDSAQGRSGRVVAEVRWRLADDPGVVAADRELLRAARDGGLGEHVTWIEDVG